MKTKICDRCNNIIHYNIFDSIRNYYNCDYIINHHKIDLCNNCEKSFLMWLNNKQVKECKDCYMYGHCVLPYVKDADKKKFKSCAGAKLKEVLE